MASGSSSYKFDKGNNFFAVSEDDEDLDREFLKGAKSPSTTADERQKQLLHERAMIEERTINSSLRSITLLRESEDIGISTAEELSRQREQLENTNQKLDEINSSLRLSERHIQGIKSVFGSIKNYFSAPPKAFKTQSPTQSLDTTSPTVPKSESNFSLKSPTSETIGNSNSTNFKRGEISNNFGSSSLQSGKQSERKVDEILDQNLGIMGDSLSRLKGLGLSLQQEIEDQNQLIERIIPKVENVDHRINNQNKDMTKILKK